MSKGRRVDSPMPDGVHIPVRLFDRVRALFGLPDMPVIVADEIARQIDALPDSAQSPQASAYGRIAPPFARTFVEASGYVEALRNFPAGIVQRGVAMYDVSTEPFATQCISPQHRQVIPVGTRWTLACWGWLYIIPLRTMETFASPLFLHLDTDGYLLDDTERLYSEVFRTPPGTPAVMFGVPDADNRALVGIEPMDQRGLATAMPFVLKAISAMHKRTPVDLVEPNRQARRLAERKEHLKLHSYYVLKVKPTPEGKPASFHQVGQPERSGTRDHLVRGHFRVYGDKGLFGKYANRTIFVPEHRRGADDYGDIRKDYEPEE